MHTIQVHAVRIALKMTAMRAPPPPPSPPPLLLLLPLLLLSRSACTPLNFIEIETDSMPNQTQSMTHPRSEATMHTLQRP